MRCLLLGSGDRERKVKGDDEVRLRLFCLSLFLRCLQRAAGPPLSIVVAALALSSDLSAVSCPGSPCLQILPVLPLCAGRPLRLLPPNFSKWL